MMTAAEKQASTRRRNADRRKQREAQRKHDREAAERLAREVLSSNDATLDQRLRAAWLLAGAQSDDFFRDNRCGEEV